MATLNIDTTQATANVKNLDSALEGTQETLKDVNKESDNLSDSLKNTGKAAESMTDGIGAADKMLGALTEASGKLGGIAGTAISKTIPALRSGLKGATLSFKTLGKAIAATGIGLLIEGVALVVTHFKEAQMWVQNFAASSKNSLPGVTKLVNGIKNGVEKIASWLRELGQKIMGSKLAQKLGLDKFAQKLATIRSAAKEATEATRAQIDAMERLEKTSAKSGGTKRTQVDALGTVNNALTSRSADAASSVAAKKEVKRIEAVNDAYKRQKNILEMIDDAFKRMNEDAKNLSETQKANADALVTSIASVAGAVATMVEKNSAAYKALMTVQIIATTAAGAMSAFTAADNITMVQKWASFAAILAAGAAQLTSLYTNKLETKTVTAVSPTLAAPMTGAQSAVATAQITSTKSEQQVYITDKQLQDNNASNVRLRQNTVH